MNSNVAYNVLLYVSLGVGYIGVAVIVWGVVLAIVSFIRCELGRFRCQDIVRAQVSLRNQFGSYLLLGLEFLIAADIIKTIAHPTLTDVAILGGIVAIRTVISFLLDREIASFGRSDKSGT